jgi:hypothetical protein
MPLTADDDLEPQALRAAIMKGLIENGIAKVTITFDGYGDDGQIEEITCTKSDGSKGTLEFPANISGKSATADSKVWDSGMRQYVPQVPDHTLTMAQVIDDWAWEVIAEAGVDWINGEGGFGEMVVTPATDSIECEINQRVTEVETTHHEL